MWSTCHESSNHGNTNSTPFPQLGFLLCNIPVCSKLLCVLIAKLDLLIHSNRPKVSPSSCQPSLRVWVMEPSSPNCVQSPLTYVDSYNWCVLPLTRHASRSLHAPGPSSLPMVRTERSGGGFGFWRARCSVSLEHPFSSEPEISVQTMLDFSCLRWAVRSPKRCHLDQNSGPRQSSLLAQCS